MAFGWPRIARVWLAVAAALLPFDLARAEDEAEHEPSPISTVIFGSMEAGPTKRFASAGIKRAIGAGLGRSGFRLLVKAGASQEPSRRLPPRGVTVKAESLTLLGYEWRLGPSFVTLYAGLETEAVQRRLPFAVSAPATRSGGRLQADLWSNPMPGMMVQAGASISVTTRRFWGRGAVGWQLPASIPIGSRVFVGPNVYLGPEIETHCENGYSQLRAGVHATGLRLLGVEWRLSGGWQQSSSKASQLYATLGAHWLQ